MRRLLVLIGALAAAVTLASGAGSRGAADATSCPTITALDGRPGWPAGGLPVAINSSGQVVGVRLTERKGSFSRHAFLWYEGASRELGSLRGGSTSPKAVNDAGDVVGSSDIAAGRPHAFLWRAGGMTDLGTLPGGTASAAIAVNGRDQVVGWSTVASGERHVFLWQVGSMKDLGTLGGAASNTSDPYLAINDRGEIAGSGAVLWRAGRLTHLGVLPLGYKNNDAVGINDSGQVAGYSGARGGQIHAFLWQDGRMTDLGTLPGGTETRATAIDDSGRVVGWGDTRGDATGAGPNHAFLWRNGAMSDLGTLRGDLASYAVGINDDGEIVGVSSRSEFGAQHAALWTMKPAPGTCPASNVWQTGDSVVVRPSSITTVSPISALKADAGRAMIVVPTVGPETASLGDCEDIFVWNRPAGKLVTVFDHRRCASTVPLQGFGDVALTGDRAAWVYLGGGDILESQLLVTSLATGRASEAALEMAGGQGGYGRIVTEPEGDGGLLAYNDSLLCMGGPDAGPPDVPCPAGVPDGTIVSDQVLLALPRQGVIATSEHELTVLAAGGGRVVIRDQAGSVIVLAPKRVRTGLVRYRDFEGERVIAIYDYSPGEDLDAATDGRTLALLHRGTLDVIPLPGSHLARRVRRIPAAAKLTDVDGSVAVYLYRDAVHLLDLTTGHGAVMTRPATGLVDAQLEPDGLYVATGRTVTFTSRAEVAQRLG